MLRGLKVVGTDVGDAGAVRAKTDPAVIPYIVRMELALPYTCTVYLIAEVFAPTNGVLPRVQAAS